MELRRADHTTVNRKWRPPAACQRLWLPRRHRSLAMRYGHKAPVQLGRKVTPAFDLHSPPFAARFGCKVVARSRAQIDNEHIYLHDYQSAPQLEDGLARYFHFYNHERLHQALAYHTPAEVHATAHT